MSGNQPNPGFKLTLTDIRNLKKEFGLPTTKKQEEKAQAAKSPGFSLKLNTAMQKLAADAVEPRKPAVPNGFSINVYGQKQVRPIDLLAREIQRQENIAHVPEGDLALTRLILHKQALPAQSYTNLPPPFFATFQNEAERKDALQLDDYQQAAINGMQANKYACCMGAAGTGKTTIERMLLAALEAEMDIIDIGNYANTSDNPDAKETLVTAIACGAYTGKAVQQQKRSLPTKYSKQCMTIHRMLGFRPIWIDHEDGSGKQKRIFVPTYTAGFKMPWRVIVLDEASMIPIALWNQFIVACRPDCRIYLIGDLNQLPPVHGKSVFGYSLSKWPSFELLKIHRQKGQDNPIVDNAWRILKGQIPVNVPGKFDMIQIPTDEIEAQNIIVKAAVGLSRKGEFNFKDDAQRKGDMVVLAQNKHALGQLEINQRLIPYFNPPPAKKLDDQITGRRVNVLAGYERRTFAIGDKVMATVNDYELGVTNGMTGTVVDVVGNGNYTGKSPDASFTAAHVDQFMAQLDKFELATQDLNDAPSAKTDEEDPRKRQASHVIKVDFGETEEGEPIVVDFMTAGAVNSLQFAWAATCHKLQGSECETIIVLCHQKNHKSLNREWLYTACTRASKRVILLYTDRGLMLALNRQNIKGNNLQEKAQAFIQWTEEYDGDYNVLPQLPEPTLWKGK